MREGLQPRSEAIQGREDRSRQQAGGRGRSADGCPVGVWPGGGVHVRANVSVWLEGLLVV